MLEVQRIKNEVLLLAASYNTVARNLSVTLGNLNKHGLWWMLWKPQPEKTNIVTKPAAKQE